MSLGRHAFKLNDAARLLRALMAAGLTIHRVELDDGKVTAVTNNEPEDESVSPVNKRSGRRKAAAGA
jgi:hypothetical protein